MKSVGIRTGQLVLLELALILTACGGGEPSLQEEALRLQPTVQRLSIAPGGTATLAVKVERLGRLSGAVVVTAEGGPAGLSSVEPLILSETETEGTLLLKASAQAETGARGRMLLSAWSGNELYHSSVDVDVIAPFSISTPVSAVSVGQAQSVSMVVNLKRTAGFKEPVRIAPSPELPTGISVSPGPILLQGEVTTASFQIHTSFDAVAASAHRITFFATWGDIVATTVLTVNINPGPSFWDESFGSFGSVQLPEPRYISWAVVQPDGRLLLATGYGTSSIWVYRLMPNGSVDTTFGQQGVVEFGLTEYHSNPRVLLQPDGKVLVLTFYQGRVLLYRLQADGSQDTAFGNLGQATANLASYGHVGDMALQEDGRILVAAITGTDVECVRFSSTGQLDDTYGTSGRATLHSSTGLSFGDIRLRVDSLGATVVFGSSGNSDIGKVFLGRLTSQGQKHTPFGINGVASISVAPYFHLQSIARVPDGGWVVSGHVGVDNKVPGEHRLLRLYEDTAATGQLWTATLASKEFTSQVAVLSDGRVLAMMNGQIKRWLANGQPDSTFQVNSTFGNQLIPLPGDAVLVGQYTVLRKLRPPTP